MVSEQVKRIVRLQEEARKTIYKELIDREKLSRREVKGILGKQMDERLPRSIKTTDMMEIVGHFYNDAEYDGFYERLTLQ